VFAFESGLDKQVRRLEQDVENAYQDMNREVGGLQAQVYHARQEFSRKLESWSGQMYENVRRAYRERQISPQEYEAYMKRVQLLVSRATSWRGY